MRKLVLANNISLDGFADHTIAMADDELHDFFSGLLDETGIELFGRVTYQMMETFWPHAHEDPAASKSVLDFADKFNAIPKIVFSGTLENAEWKNTTLVRSNALEHVAGLKEIKGKNLYVGGIKLAGSLMRHGLVDEYWLVVNPVIAGERTTALRERKNEDESEAGWDCEAEFGRGRIALHERQRRE